MISCLPCCFCAKVLPALPALIGTLEPALEALPSFGPGEALAFAFALPFAFGLCWTAATYCSAQSLAAPASGALSSATSFMELVTVLAAFMSATVVRTNSFNKFAGFSFKSFSSASFACFLSSSCSFLTLSRYCLARSIRPV